MTRPRSRDDAEIGEATHENSRPDPRPNAIATAAPTRPSLARQWWVLTRRTAAVLRGSRLTIAILAGSPLMVIAMFAVLFRAGAMDRAHTSPTAAVMIVFWIAFGSFFFGITYGLTQIVTERAVFRHDRIAGIAILPYVLSKLAALLPVLVGVDALMLGLLRLLDRIPAAGTGTYASLAITVLLSGIAALSLGLLTSAVVSDHTQAIMALPMLCFPQVLFSGAIVPLIATAGAGRAIAMFMSTRWTFRALGHALKLDDVLQHSSSPLGPPLRAEYATTFSHALPPSWLILGACAALCLVATGALLARR
jgi:ABC-2 type transporter